MKINMVLVLGNATLDIVQQVSRFPEPGETLLAQATLRCAGGKGLNQAVAAARTGAVVRLAAPVGRDADAAFLAGSLSAEPGLAADWLQRASPTDLSVIWVSRGGENVIVSSAECALSLQPDEARHLCRRLAAGDVLVLQGNLSPGTTLAAAEEARAQGARIVLNTAPLAWDMAAVLALADIVIANAGEAAALAQCPDVPSGADPARVLHALGVPVIIVTLGAAGARVVSHDDDITLPAPPVTAVDTAGAGDVFAGTLAGLLAQGRDVMSAARIAVAAASQSVTRAGTTPSFPTREAINALATLTPMVPHA